ncbi:hypothetical protein V8F20_012853 [Naviculisporaceae sp. PSN 640]
MASPSYRAPPTTNRFIADRQNINTDGGTQFNNSVFNGPVAFSRPPELGHNAVRAKQRIAFLQALQQHGLRDYERRKDINRTPTPGTCLWFKNHKHFKTWLHSSGPSLLWVSADPGCGKSVLAKHLIDSSVLKKPDDDRTTLSYFFFKDTFDQQDVVHALCCILFQIYDQRPDLITERLLQRFEVNKRLLRPSFDTIWPIFKDLVYNKDAGQVVCVLDGVDECHEQQLPQFIDRLREIYDSGTSSAKLKVMLLSRPYERIRANLIGHIPVIHLSGESEAEMEQISDEIDHVIKARVKEFVQRKKFLPDSPEARQAESLVLERILAVPNRTYLWAHLTLEMLNDTAFAEGDDLVVKITKVTSKLPQTVDDAYERILANISRPKAAKTLLHLVVTATRPLSLREIYTALQFTPKHDVEEGFARDSPFSDVRLSDREIQHYIRECCSLFVVVVGQKDYLLHQTAKEFLVGKPRIWPIVGRAKSTWKSSILDQKSHSLFARVCVDSLRSISPAHPFLLGVEGLSDARLPAQRENSAPALLEYAAMNWGYHLRQSPKKIQKRMVEDALQLCDVDSVLFGKWFGIFWAQTGTDLPANLRVELVTAMLGLKYAMSQFVKEDGVSLAMYQDDTYRRSALSWAVIFGHHDVVNVLVSSFSRTNLIGRRRVDASWPCFSRDISHQTPIFHAILNGHLGIARKLIDAGAIIDDEDNIGGTPLLYAMLKRQMELVDLLKEKGVATTGKSGGQAPEGLLLSAARQGNPAIVPLLLDVIKDPEKITNPKGESPLRISLSRRHHQVVQILVASRKAIAYQEDVELAAEVVGSPLMDQLLLITPPEIGISELALWLATENQDSRVLISLLSRKGLLSDYLTW